MRVQTNREKMHGIIAKQGDISCNSCENESKICMESFSHLPFATETLESLTCCSSGGRLSSFCDMVVSSPNGIDLRLSMISGNLSDFS